MPETRSFDPQSWNRLVSGLPYAHVLQTWEWGQVKARVGWQVLPQAWDGPAAALLLQRTVPAGGFAAKLRILYTPKGPLLDWNNAALRRSVLQELVRFARKQGAIFIKIDPDLPLGYGIPGTPEAQDNPAGLALLDELRQGGWIFSQEQIQFRNTAMIDLTPSEDMLLAQMKQKTRYNINLAQRKGVTIRPGSTADLPLLYRMYAETSVRDGFVIRDEPYYHFTWETFMLAGMAEPLVAEVEGEPVAAVMIFRFAGKAWYLYGMSRSLHREKMPNYLLQWEAMRRAKAAGCTQYDLWGAPDEFNESDSLWGVYRFKEGLGAKVVRTMGAWDLPLRPTFYRLYTQTLPRLLNVMRRRGRSQTRQVLGS